MKRSAISWIVALAIGVGGVAWLQPSLASTLRATKAREDVYAFPAPEQLRLLTLGHRAAVADLLWVKLRIEYGIHWSERRDFPDASRYLDAIVALDPAFEAPYKYGDTIVIYQIVAGDEADARWSKAFLEKGTHERPHDAELWAHYGQFLVFMAPTYIKDKTTLAEWRHEGALALARSVELGGDAAHGRTAATMLDESGQRDAAIRALQNAYAMSDDPSEREHILQLLVAYHGDAQKEAAEKHFLALEMEWSKSYPFLTRGSFLLVGPQRDPLACAGRVAAADPKCGGSWPEVGAAKAGTPGGP